MTISRGWWRHALVALMMATAACAPAGPAALGEGTVGGEAAAPKRVTAVAMGNAHTLYQKLNISNGIPGIDALGELVGAGLARVDPYGQLQPQLAEEIPTLENGLWKAFADGRMETTWKVNSSARWHDGMPFSGADVLFTAQIEQDKALPAFRDRKYAFVESFEAPDPYTVLVKWRSPSFEADQPFGVPLPAHILQDHYAADTTGFTDLPYFTDEYVGTGPFRVRQFERGSHIVLEAFDGYVLGRPKIDLIEVRFIPDPNTLLANVLADEVELTLGRTLSPDQALEARNRWQSGRVEFGPSYLHRIVTQLDNPRPAVIANVTFRQALYYAMDRRGIADTIFAGMAPVPHSVLIPNQPQYRDVYPNVPDYPYDPRRAARLVESLGYTKGADGFYGSPGGERLGGVELRATDGDDSRLKILYAVADQWQKAGVGVDILVVPLARNQDRQYRAERPGFVLTGGGADEGQLQNFISSESPTPQNNYLGANYAVWSNPRYDNLYERYLVTLRRADRMQLVTEMLRILAEEVPIYPVLYQVDATVTSHRVGGVLPYANGVRAWDAHLWDVR